MREGRENSLISILHTTQDYYNLSGRLLAGSLEWHTATSSIVMHMHIHIYMMISLARHTARQWEPWQLGLREGGQSNISHYQMCSGKDYKHTTNKLPTMS